MDEGNAPPLRFYFMIKSPLHHYRERMFLASGAIKELDCLGILGIVVFYPSQITCFDYFDNLAVMAQ